tara:strand:- start:585 stop:1142 length:558 start_codon:yes stop_codon:yes gene_type:complete
MKTTILEYDPTRYNFREWACEVLGVKDLEAIHSLNTIRTFNVSPTSNQLVRSFSSILEIYKSFIEEVLDKEIGGITDYQSPPSFRFHYSGLGSSVFHRDRDFGVEQGRINAWVPLTNVWGDNSLWIEGKEGAEDHQPVTMRFGQILLFDGVNISHGSKINTTSLTRVSFDFRLNPGAGPLRPASY